MNQESSKDIECPWCGVRIPADSIDCTACGKPLPEISVRDNGSMSFLFDRNRITSVVLAAGMILSAGTTLGSFEAGCEAEGSHAVVCFLSALCMAVATVGFGALLSWKKWGLIPALAGGVVTGALLSVAAGQIVPLIVAAAGAALVYGSTRLTDDNGWSYLQTLDCMSRSDKMDSRK